MITPDDVGKWGILHTAQSQYDVVAEGRIIAHSLVPSVLIEQPDGTRVWWRQDLGELADEHYACHAAAGSCAWDGCPVQTTQETGACFLRGARPVGSPDPTG